MMVCLIGSNDGCARKRERTTRMMVRRAASHMSGATMCIVGARTSMIGKERTRKPRCGLCAFYLYLSLSSVLSLPPLLEL